MAVNISWIGLIGSSPDISSFLADDSQSRDIIGWWDGSSVEYNQLGDGTGPCAVVDSVGSWQSVPCDGTLFGYTCEKDTVGKPFTYKIYLNIV